MSVIGIPVESGLHLKSIISLLDEKTLVVVAGAKLSTRSRQWVRTTNAFETFQKIGLAAARRLSSRDLRVRVAREGDGRKSPLPFCSSS